MLRLILISLLMFNLVLLPSNTNVKASKNNLNQKCTDELLIEQAFLTSMSLKILDAINVYYKGKGKLFFLSSITNVTKDSSQGTFNVTVQAVTFKGALLPPFGLETITFEIPGFKVIDYKHKDISEDEELSKDKFYYCY